MKMKKDLIGQVSRLLIREEFQVKIINTKL